MLAFLCFQTQFILKYVKCWSLAGCFTPRLCFPCHRQGPSRYSRQQQWSHGKFFLERSYSLNYCSAADSGAERDLALCFYMTYSRGCLLALCSSPSVPAAVSISIREADARESPALPHLPAFAALRAKELPNVHTCYVFYVFRYCNNILPYKTPNIPHIPLPIQFIKAIQIAKSYPRLAKTWFSLRQKQDDVALNGAREEPGHLQLQDFAPAGHDCGTNPSTRS